MAIDPPSVPQLRTLRITNAIGETCERRNQATNFSGASNLAMARHRPDGHDSVARPNPAQLTDAAEIHKSRR